jgi:membrane-bound lytic murein transglycosylase F
MGYEYELLKAFAAAHQLALKMVVVEQRDSLMQMLLAGRGDVVAARLVPLPADTGRIAYTRAIYHTDPVLVQRNAPTSVALRKLPKPVDTVLKPGPAEPKGIPVRARLVQRPSQLAGQRVTVPEKGPYTPSLIELADSVSGDVQVVEVDSSSEALIRAVARGTEAFTVAEGNVARLQGAYYGNLMIKPVLGGERPVAWAVRRGSRQLRDTLNAWIADEKTRGVLVGLYRKYFIDARGYEERVQSRYLTSETGTLSPYDDLLRRYAAQLGWDWRLLGSQMYQESRFKPTARSWAGAVGLLQLMPATAKSYGVRNRRNPEQNVRGAVKFLQWLDSHFKDRIRDDKERLKFVLASFNAGAGHVEDAQRLAEKHGDDPTKWDDVAYWLLQKSKTEFYNDPVVKYGFCRGIEPVTYVAVILDRFQHYRQFVVERPTAQRTTGD